MSPAGDHDGTQRIRIDLAYDGTPYHGFARQRDQITVQGTLEGALRRVTGQDVTTTGAGRTDAGVHALGQVVHGDVDGSVPAAGRWLALVRRDPEAARRRLDRMVGDAITVWSIAGVSDDFDARFSATELRYRYHLVDAPYLDPRLRTVRWCVGGALRLRPMQQAAAHLVGEHDFASLCRRADAGHTRRRIDEIAVSRPAPSEIQVRLRAPAFCHQQVRAIVGCLVEVGRGNRPPDWLADVLAARDRSAAARVAPPQGLTLEAVRYGRRWPPSPPVDLP
jgi:tRNA pseudouridine38-40 synthase